ncbi:MAG: hypothetical protein CVU09_09160 [Bacteroidetes bacterium HGW-Bacteroidetes-4]|nr:MAG: hypothetical protein CVU09_09160 [Bacteroidetes bacterium HGW-Bacteroidetes-4]
MNYLNRYEAFLKQQGINYWCQGNLLLREYGSIIIPLGPALIPEPPAEIDAATVFRHLKGKLLWWSYQKSGFESNAWYAVIKDRHLNLDEYRTANIRNQVKKGLKNFQIKGIPAQILVQQGYVIYQSAIAAYHSRAPLNESEYRKFMEILQEFDDIIEPIGIFYKQQLIGYSLIYRYGNHEANISEIRIQPKYKDKYPSYALFHWLSEEYLLTKKVAYISDGYRNLMHTTNIQELLIRKFGFRKQGLYLECELNKPYHYFFNSFLSAFLRKLPLSGVEAIFTLLDIKKQQ